MWFIYTVVANIATMFIFEAEGLFIAALKRDHPKGKPLAYTLRHFSIKTQKPFLFPSTIKN